MDVAPCRVIIETVFADLIDGPLAHLPSERFGANSAWVLCRAIAHNLLHATGSLASHGHAVARGVPRRPLITVPAAVKRYRFMLGWWRLPTPAKLSVPFHAIPGRGRQRIPTISAACTRRGVNNG